MDDNNIIYEYTDEQAIDDGVLVDVRDQRLYLSIPTASKTNQLRLIDRITSNLVAELAPMSVEDILATIDNELVKADYSDLGLIKMENTVFIPANQTIHEIWIMPNERGNYTIMLPSDY